MNTDTAAPTFEERFEANIRQISIKDLREERQRAAEADAWREGIRKREEQTERAILINKEVEKIEGERLVAQRVADRAEACRRLGITDPEAA